MMARRKKKTRREKTTSRVREGKKTAFRRQEEVEDLRAWGDVRWRKAAHKDLEELAEDETGLDRLADAIKAILRSKR